MRRASNGLRATWAVLVLTACRPAANDVVSVDLVIKDRQARLDFDLEEGRSYLESKLSRISGFRLGEPSPGESGWQLTARLPLVTDRTDDADLKMRRRAIGVDLSLRRLGAGEGTGEYRVEVMERAVVPPSTPAQPFLERALDAALARMATSVRLASGKAKTLKEAVLGPDEHARAVATEYVRTRRLEEVAPALVKRLAMKDTGPQETLRIAGALRVVGGESASTALIDAISRHPQVAVPLLFVLAEVGGGDAEAYLFTVSSGHPQAEVRKAAEEALAERARRVGSDHP